MAWYTPTTELTEEDVEKGLKVLTWEALTSHSMVLLVTGALLPGMALALGASNFVIGLLASFAPIAQMAQIPAILVVEKVGLRKLLTVIFSAVTELYAWHRLSLIEEAGTVSESEIRDEVFASVRNSIFGTGGLSMGMRRMTAFPYEMLRKTGRGISSVGRVGKKRGEAPPADSGSG